MPLASTVAAPRLVAALLLHHRSRRRRAAAPECVEKGRPQGGRVDGVRRADRRADRHLFLTQLEPVTTRWIISVFVAALLVLLISGWRYHGKDHPAISVGVGGLAGFCSGLAQTGGPPIVAYWLGRPIACGASRAPTSSCTSGSSDIVSFAIYYAATGILITEDAIKLVAGGRPGLRARRLVRRLAVRHRQRNAVPRDLLRLIAARRAHRPAVARRRAALAPSTRSQ